MRSSVVDRDNNYCRYVIVRNAGFAITLHYHPAGVYNNRYHLISARVRIKF
jgi:hypothetical protein